MAAAREVIDLTSDALQHDAYMQLQLVAEHGSVK